MTILSSPLFWGALSGAALVAIFHVGKEWGRHIERNRSDIDSDLFFINDGGGYVRFSPAMTTPQRLDLLRRAIACIEDAPSVKNEFDRSKDEASHDSHQD